MREQLCRPVRVWPVGGAAVVVSWLFCCAALLPAAGGARILAVQTFPGKSLANFLSGTLRALTDGGHHVTVFTQFPEGDRENYTEVDVSGPMPRLVGQELSGLVRGSGTVAAVVREAVRWSRYSCDAILRDDRMRPILRQQTDGGGGAFDVFLVDPIASDCVTYPAVVLNLPVVYVVASPMLNYLERAMVGDVTHPAAVSHFMADSAVPDTFARRFANVAATVLGCLFLNYLEWTANWTADPRPPYDLVGTVAPRASLVLLHNHFSVDAPRPFPPNVIHVAGISLRPAESLPQEILEFIEGSTQGVIYLSFGSMVAMSKLPDHVHNTLKEALARLPQRILWKYEGEMKDKPKNVMTNKWFPQRDVLLHPNIKLYIGHGGLSGVYEAVDAGVPMLGFPLFYDEPVNVDHLVRAGMAISMDLTSINTESFLKNVFELINNENYTKNAKITSKRFKDRPISAAQSVRYWIEYVIRHKGAPHLRSDAHNLTWYQYLLLDVIFVIVIFMCIVIFIAVKVFKCIRKYFSHTFKSA